MRTMTALASFIACGVTAAPRSSLACEGFYDDAIGTLDMLGNTYLGAGPQRRPMRQRGAQAPRIARSRLVPDVPGVPASGLRLQPLGLGSTTFTSASGLVLSLTGSPQKPFKPQRLILDVTRTGAAAGLITVQRIDIGADNMLVSAGGVGGMPASMFANNGVDLNVSFAPATPGILIQVQLATSAAPAGADVIVVSGGMLGTSFGH